MSVGSSPQNVGTVAGPSGITADSWTQWLGDTPLPQSHSCHCLSDLSHPIHNHGILSNLLHTHAVEALQNPHHTDKMSAYLLCLTSQNATQGHLLWLLPS